MFLLFLCECDEEEEELAEESGEFWLAAVVGETFKRVSREVLAILCMDSVSLADEVLVRLLALLTGLLVPADEMDEDEDEGEIELSWLLLLLLFSVASLAGGLNGLMFSFIKLSIENPNGFLLLACLFTCFGDDDIFACVYCLILCSDRRFSISVFLAYCAYFL